MLNCVNTKSITCQNLKQNSPISANVRWTAAFMPSIKAWRLVTCTQSNIIKYFSHVCTIPCPDLPMQAMCGFALIKHIKITQKWIIGHLQLAGLTREDRNTRYGFKIYTKKECQALTGQWTKHTTTKEAYRHMQE